MNLPCALCTIRQAVGVCCSSHGQLLCHTCYRQTHFVEVCVSWCPDCAREGIAPRPTAEGIAEGDNKGSFEGDQSKGSSTGGVS